MTVIGIIKSFWANSGLMLLSQRYSVKNAAAYRLQLIMSLIDTGIGAFVPVLFLGAVYFVSTGIQGWSFYQLVTLSGLVNFSSVVLYFATPQRINNVLKTGYFDTYLTKPHNPVIMLFARADGFWSLIYSIWGLAVAGYGAYAAGFSLVGLVPSLVLLLGGIVTMCMFSLFMGVVAYRLFGQANFQNWLLSNVMNFGNYPLNIYGSIGIGIFTFLAPVGLATFYPATILFGKTDLVYALGLLGVEILLSGIFFNAATRLLKGYTSAQG